MWQNPVADAGIFNSREPALSFPREWKFILFIQENLPELQAFVKKKHYRMCYLKSEHNIWCFVWV